MNLARGSLLAACLGGLLAGGCVAPLPARHAVAVAPAAVQGWVRTELYFGLGPAAQPQAGVGDAQWRRFLDREVTPRFPDGLSVIDIHGQWRDNVHAPVEHERSRLLVLVYVDGPRHRADIEAIRAAWKRETGERSVLRVTQAVDASF
jgi:hypothetical protein